MSRLVAGVLALLLLCAPGALAQEKKKDSEHTRGVKGLVLSPDGKAVKQAVVYLKNTKTLQIHSFITKDDGSYYFNELSPDIDYELTGESEGLKSPTRTLSSFDDRKQVVMDLKLSKNK
jgi:hypothetical protein